MKKRTSPEQDPCLLAAVLREGRKREVAAAGPLSKDRATANWKTAAAVRRRGDRHNYQVAQRETAGMMKR